MYLVVVLFALQPEDYNSFSENEPPFLCIEQNEHHSSGEFNDEAVISRTLRASAVQRLRLLVLSLLRTLIYINTVTVANRATSGAYIHPNAPYFVYTGFSTSPSITVFLYSIRDESYIRSAMSN